MRCAFAVCAVLSVACSTAGAQTIRVAVSMTDSATKGLFASLFASSFRALGGVQVVSTNESPQFILEGSVLCEPADCGDPVSYTLGLRLFSPLDTSLARLIAGGLVSADPIKTYLTRRDSGTVQLLGVLGEYEKTHDSWVVQWGRARYEQAARELVHRIDAECFEVARARSRSQQTSNRGALTAWATLLKATRSTC